MIKDDMLFRRTKVLALSSLALLGAAGAVSAQTNSALLINPFPKEQAVQARGSAIFLESGHIAEPENDEGFQMSLYNASGMFRLKPGELESPRVGFDVAAIDIQGGFDGLPEKLLDQSVAVGFPVGKYGEWIFGASLGVGYAGDSFGGDGDAYYGLASIAAFWQMDETSAVVFVVDYDGNRTFLPDIPLPGAAYIKRINDKLELTAGIPVTSIRWTPIEKLTVGVAYSIPDNVGVDVGYELLPHFTVFGRALHQREAFYFDGLPENHDRILFEQRRAEAGIRYEPCKEFHADLAVGYAWNTEFSEGFDSRKNNEIADVSDEPYIRAGLELRF